MLGRGTNVTDLGIDPDSIMPEGDLPVASSIRSPAAIRIALIKSTP